MIGITHALLATSVPARPNRLGKAGMNLAAGKKKKTNTNKPSRTAQVSCVTHNTGTRLDGGEITRYNDPMSNTMNLTLAELANTDLNSDAWVWKDDMITFCEWEEDELNLYDDGSSDRILRDMSVYLDHPICGEFPHDSIVAPRGWDKVD